MLRPLNPRCDDALRELLADYQRQRERYRASCVDGSGRFRTRLQRREYARMGVIARRAQKAIEAADRLRGALYDVLYDCQQSGSAPAPHKFEAAAQAIDVWNGLGPATRVTPRSVKLPALE